MHCVRNLHSVFNGFGSRAVCANPLRGEPNHENLVKSALILQAHSDDRKSGQFGRNFVTQRGGETLSKRVPGLFQIPFCEIIEQWLIAILDLKEARRCLSLPLNIGFPDYLTRIKARTLRLGDSSFQE